MAFRGVSDGGVPAGEIVAAEIVRGVAAGETRYEFALPREKLTPISPGDGSFGATILLNENDGAGREGWIT